ncbi:unnamed protein product [Paramecium primaurelia]|uniref:Uncharacterized protein n=1 Tax=Paramecium primaurelia TaxID=5886 RepID=A0A8S1KSV6_PARPR|nr:unnamed protein product [Paramecium primaurelia]
MEFNKPLFLQIMNEQKYNIKTLQSIYKELLEELFIIATYHSRIEKSYDRTKKEVEYNLNKIFNELFIEIELIQKQKQISQTVFDQLTNILKTSNIKKKRNMYLQEWKGVE